MRPSVLSALLCVVALGLSGCGSRRMPVTVPAADVSVNSGIGGQVIEEQVVMGLAATYEVALDLAIGSATVDVLTPHQGQQDNDDLYLLPLTSFFKQEHFVVDRVSLTDDDVILDYTIHHPFAAPVDWTAQASATNRADLGFAGMVLLLADVPTATDHTYFSDVVLNADLVANADAYYRPAGLLAAGTIANTFPYKLIVDESGEGNRVGISNGGDPRGNFGPGGWGGDSLGELGTGWTGYGVLHQGQAASNTWRLRRSAIPAGQQVTLRFAIVAKYNDPRYGLTQEELLRNRLPGSPAYYKRFAYRMPHGALDVERVEFLKDAGGLERGKSSATQLSLRLTDWDARATPTSITPLANDPEVHHVRSGAEGLPQLAISIPSLWGIDEIRAWDGPAAVFDDDLDFGDAGDLAPESGDPDDGLLYQPLLSLEVPIDLVALPCLLQLTDPSKGSFKQYLNAQLQPLSSETPANAVYQVVLLTPGAPRPFHGFVTWPEETELSDRSPDVWDLAFDPQGNVVCLSEIRDPGDIDPGVAVLPPPADARYGLLVSVLSPTGQLLRSAAMGSGSIVTALHDPASLSVASDGSIYVTGMVSRVADFDPGPGTVLSNLPIDRRGSFLLKLNSALEYEWHQIWNDEGFDMSIAPKAAVDAVGNVYVCGQFRGTIDFDNGPGEALAVSPIYRAQFALALDPDGNLRWLAPVTGYQMALHAVTTTPAGEVIFAGERDHSGFLVKYGGDGGQHWQKTFVGAKTVPVNLALDHAGNIYIAGQSREYGKTDFDPGPGEALITHADNVSSWLCSLDAAGGYRWATALARFQQLDTWNGNTQISPALAVSECRGVLIAGEVANYPTDLDPGPDTETFVPVYDSLVLQWFSFEGEYFQSIIWDGASEERFPAILTDDDCGYILAGDTRTDDFDLSPDEDVVPYSSVSYGGWPGGTFLLRN